MSATTQLLVGANSDVGRKRTENEDRFFIDAHRGIFLVVDGLGGHAAGERAAEIAVDIISTRLSRRTGASDKRIQEAFALASTEIFEAASRHPQWAGMACVATVALIEEDQVTVGHVGDSRLYLLTPGRIEKITRDHSPVGELEDSQRLSEDAAMRHPRRSEVYRDLGSTAHTPNDTDFVEIHSFALPQPAALLLCSDGLTDQMTAADIRRLIEHHAGDPEKAARALVEAANEAGGKDNVTVVLVETEDYAGSICCCRACSEFFSSLFSMDLVSSRPSRGICRVPGSAAVLGELHIRTQTSLWGGALATDLDGQSGCDHHHWSCSRTSAARRYR